MSADTTRARAGAKERHATADEFARRLRALGAAPARADSWLVVGKPTQVAGWKLHLSATVGAVERLFQCVIPYLVRRGTPFKMPAERHMIVQLNAGNWGETQIGKVITVYPPDDADAVALAHELTALSRGIVGPRVPTDLHLGEAIYTRYGAVCPRIIYDRFGEPSDLIPDGTGNWIVDVRAVPFSCPQSVRIPFAGAARSEPPAPGPVRALLAGRYFVTDVLRPGIDGSVLRAIDLAAAGGPSACVLKQARPYCSEDLLGRDHRARLRHEAVMLARLRGLKGIAPAGAYFEDQESGYLPLAYVSGRTLAERVDRWVSGRAWLSLRAQVRRRLLRYAVQLVRRLRSAHARGVLHRDVSPGNVWIGADDQVYLLDWECAHLIGSRTAAFRLATPGFSDGNTRAQVPSRADDWRACARVLTFMLTGLDPAALLHGGRRELTARLAQLTGLRDSSLIVLLARALADRPTSELDAALLLRALPAAVHGRTTRRPHAAAPLYQAAAHETVLAEGLEQVTVALRSRLDRIVEGSACAAPLIDAASGIAGLLYVLAAAHRAQVIELDATLGDRAVRVLTAGAPITPDLPGLVHGRAGRALAVAAAMQAGCVRRAECLRTALAQALGGRLDWPDFTHGAAGQGFAALGCARRLGMSDLALSADACAAYLIRTQDADGAWTLPQGAPGASGERYTGFAHGAAGMMAFLGSYAAMARNADAQAAWRRAEGWLLRRARRSRGGQWQWPQSDSRAAPAAWWCHGAPGIALGWLCVAEAQGTTAVVEDALRAALEACPRQLRSDSLSQCHGLAGVGEVYLQAHRVLQQECWRERAADLADVLVALFRKRSRPAWYCAPEEGAEHADGLMLGTAGILHFLLRHHHPVAVPSAPLLA